MSNATSVPSTAAASRALQVFYDGACPLCSREVKHYRTRDKERCIEWIDIARPGFDAAEYGLDPVRVQQVMHARGPGGKVYTEVGAFVKIWEALPPGLLTTPLRLLLRIPGMIRFANIFYRLFARNRYRLTGRCTPESCGVR